MTDPRRSTSSVPSDVVVEDRPQYRIMRKGSRYNILGPVGRVFVKYKSASSVGPRWEELTHSPWPYVSSAYARGTRLWELGLIDRTQVGAPEITVGAPGQTDTSEAETPAQPNRGNTPAQSTEAAASSFAGRSIVTPLALLALPAPRLDLQEHIRIMETLHHNPALIFTARAQQALHDEVLYNRPQARWARHVLGLLKRYERQQQRRRPAPVDAVTITAKHVAWQAQQINMAAIASLSC